MPRNGNSYVDSHLRITCSEVRASEVRASEVRVSEVLSLQLSQF